MKRSSFSTKYFKMRKGVLHQLVSCKIPIFNRFKKERLVLIIQISKVLQNILRRQQEINLQTNLAIPCLHISVIMTSSLMCQLHKMVYPKQTSHFNKKISREKQAIPGQRGIFLQRAQQNQRKYSGHSLDFVDFHHLRQGA